MTRIFCVRDRDRTIRDTCTGANMKVCLKLLVRNLLLTPTDSVL